LLSALIAASFPIAIANRDVDVSEQCLDSPEAHPLKTVNCHFDQKNGTLMVRTRNHRGFQLARRGS
jgi:hypothetical protein